MTKNKNSRAEKLELNLKIHRHIYGLDVGVAKAYIGDCGKVTLKIVANALFDNLTLFDTVVIHPKKTEQLSKEEFAADKFPSERFPDKKTCNKTRSSLMKELIQIDGVLVAQMQVADDFTSSLDLVNKLEDRLFEVGVNSQMYLNALSEKSIEPYRASAFERAEACLDVYLKCELDNA